MDFVGNALHWFNAGGPVMYILLLASVIAAAVIIERARYYNNAAVSFGAYEKSLRAAFSKGDLAKIKLQYEQSGRPADMIVAAALRAAERQGSLGSISHAMENAAQLAAANLRRFLPILSVLVTLAPLCGLLGTVIGMINSFSVFDLQAGSAMAITGGVGEALVATASGLAVAIAALVGHSYFSCRLDNMIGDMEKLSSIIIEELSVKLEGSGRHEAA